MPNSGIQKQIDRKLEDIEALRTIVSRLQEEDRKKEAVFTTILRPSSEPRMAF
jgi:hypothetical protein